MYCIDTEALVFMFNGGSPYGFTIHPIFTRICGTPALSMQYIIKEFYSRLEGVKTATIPVMSSEVFPVPKAVQLSRFHCLYMKYILKNLV